MKKIMVAMSGGVDSTVAALLMKNRGFDIGGITMRVWSDECRLHDEKFPPPDQNCIDAKAVACTLGIPHYTVSYGDTFKKCVIDRFIDDYGNGKTPNPCVECNRHIKFGSLFDSALEFGFDGLATGHYARIEKKPCGEVTLRKAKDESKDQSYFLWGIPKEKLSHIIFPLGNYTKKEIRDIANDFHLPCANRSDSQDICFISNGDYTSFIHSHCSNQFPTGKFVDTSGTFIGNHSGIINYTVGQRKGLGVSFGKPMFVGEKNAKDNTVTLCTDEELYKTTLIAKNINVLVNESFDSPVKLQAKIRYRHTPATATVTKIESDTLIVKFDEPQRAIAKGQSLALYDGDILVGGGIIE